MNVSRLNSFGVAGSCDAISVFPAPKVARFHNVAGEPNVRAAVD
jgi:hypothetical protein